MKLILLFGPALLFLSLIAGLSLIPPSPPRTDDVGYQFEQIQCGMSVKDVEAITGEPWDDCPNDVPGVHGQWILVWRGLEAWVWIGHDEGTVVSKCLRRASD